MKFSAVAALFMIFSISSYTQAQSIFLDDDGTMVVNGSSRNETIVVWKQTHWRRFEGRVTYVYASIQAFGFSLEERFDARDVDSIEIKAFGGNDYVENKTNIDSVIRGGNGDDTLLGGRGRDFIYGEGGSNELYGRENDDWLVSNGDAYNYLVGGSGEDLFIAFPFDRIYDPKFFDDGTELINYAFLLWPTYTSSNGSSWFLE